MKACLLLVVLALVSYAVADDFALPDSKGGLPLMTKGKKVVVGNDASLPELSGWPKDLHNYGSYGSSGPSVFDLNDDGKLEVFQGTSNGEFAVYKYDGSVLWQKTSLGRFMDKPVIGDLNNDGHYEIGITDADNYIYIWTDTGSNYSGWPLTLTKVGGYSALVFFNINATPELEVITARWNYPNGEIRAYTHNATLLWSTALDYISATTPSVGDIDGDNKPEILISSYYSLYAFDNEGHVKSGWPVSIGSMSYSQPTLCDVYGDGKLEVFMEYGTSTSNIGGWKYDGANMSGWPIRMSGVQPYNTPVVLNFSPETGNDLSIVSASSHANPAPIYTFTVAGATRTGWPFTGTQSYLEGTFTAVDFDGDNEIEIVVANNSTPGKLFGLNGNGTQTSGSPYDTDGFCGINCISACDLNGDGQLDLIYTANAGSTVRVHAYTVSGVSWIGALSPYNQFYHDTWNTGWIHPAKPKNVHTTGNGFKIAWDANTEPDILGYNVYGWDGSKWIKVNDKPIKATSYNGSETYTRGGVSAVTVNRAESYMSYFNTSTGFKDKVSVRELPAYPYFHLKYLTEGFFELEYDTKSSIRADIILFSIAGQRVWSLLNETFSGKGTKKYSSTSFAPGVYLMIVKTDKRRYLFKTVVIPSKE